MDAQEKRAWGRVLALHGLDVVPVRDVGAAPPQVR